MPFAEGTFRACASCCLHGGFARKSRFERPQWKKGVPLFLEPIDNVVRGGENIAECAPIAGIENPFRTRGRAFPTSGLK